MTQPACDICRRPCIVCVCDRIVSYPTQRRVLVLQHPQEQDALLGSAQIVLASLPKAKLVVGLSWKNLGHALGFGAKGAEGDPKPQMFNQGFGAKGAEGDPKPQMFNQGEDDVDPHKWAVLFPDREAEGNQVTTRHGTPLDPQALEGIIVLDGTWSKAKTLWWRNPWLNKLNRMSLTPTQPSIYGRLRTEPRREYVSTLESVAAALTACGESPEIEKGLSRVFRTLMQRVRDANLAPDERKLPRKSRPPRRPKPSPPPASDD